LLVYEYRVLLKRIFGPKREEVVKGGIRLHSEEFQKLYPSPNIIREITSGKIRCAGRLGRIGDR
jgi:hypothetical protein